MLVQLTLDPEQKLNKRINKIPNVSDRLSSWRKSNKAKEENKE